MSIGKYAAVHGVKAASTYFSRKLGREISTLSVHSIKAAYLECARKQRADLSDEITKLHPKKRGRPLLLGAQVEEQVQMYLKKIREEGGVVSAFIAVAASKGILQSSDWTQLAAFGGHIRLSRKWVYKLLHCMNFVKRKATTAKSKYAPDDFARIKQAFLNQVVQIVGMEQIPAELILNWDQTGINLVPASSWTMDQSGAKRVELKGVNDKRQITALFCGMFTGNYCLCN